jgi:hypothetical protein
MDENRPLGERLAAFANRAAWVRPLGAKSYTDQINNMVDHFGEMGVVEVREGPSDSRYFPPVMEVEQLGLRQVPRALRAEAAGPIVSDRVEGLYELADDLDLTNIEKVRRFPHGLRR